MTGVLHVSVACTLLELVSQSGMICGLQPRLPLAGHRVKTGVSVSTVQSMTWLHEFALPQLSVATQVRVRVRRQPLAPSTWLRVIVGAGVQPSAELTA